MTAIKRLFTTDTYDEIYAEITDMRIALHRKADRIRVLTWAHGVELERLGASAEYIELKSRWPLAWADLVDALVGDIDLPGCECGRHHQREAA